MKDSFFNQRLPLGTKFEQLIVRFLETFQDIEVIHTGSLKDNLDKSHNNVIWKKDDTFESDDKTKDKLKLVFN